MLIYVLLIVIWNFVIYFLIKGIKGCIVSFLCIGVYGYGLFYKVKSNLRFYLFYIFVENKSY